MPVRKRNGHWYVRLQLSGQRIERAVGTNATKADAQALEAKIRSDHLAGRLGRAPQRTIEQAFARWLDGEARSHKDYADTKSRVKNLLPFFAKGKLLKDAALVAEEVKEKGLRDGLKPATINRRLAALRRVCTLAFRAWGWLDDDIAARIRPLRGERQRTVYLTPAEINRLTLAANSPVREAILLSVATGLRRSELLGLTADNVQGDCIVLGTNTKSGRPRIIPVPEAYQYLLALLPFDLSDSQLREGWDAARKAARLKHVWWHDLRHTYGSLMAQHGAPMPAIRDIMGHTSLIVTSRYLHHAIKQAREAVKAFPVLSPLPRQKGNKRGRS